MESTPIISPDWLPVDLPFFKEYFDFDACRFLQRDSPWNKWNFSTPPLLLLSRIQTDSRYNSQKQKTQKKLNGLAWPSDSGFILLVLFELTG